MTEGIRELSLEYHKEARSLLKESALKTPKVRKRSRYYKRSLRKMRRNR